MKQKNIDKANTIADPEPFSTALQILTIITPIGVLIAEQTIDYFVSEKERKDEIRNALYESYRATNEAERLLKDFVSYLTQQGFLDREFRLGRAPLTGDSSLINAIKTLQKDSYNASKKLGDSMIDLSKLLDQEDFHRVARYSEELNRFLQDALRAKSYKDYSVSASKLIQQGRNIIVALGEKYNFSPSNIS